MESAIMEKAKGYETLIMCYHYCHGYCYSRLSMQGWKEEFEILCNLMAVCDRTTEILEGKKNKLWKEQHFCFYSQNDAEHVEMYSIT